MLRSLLQGLKSFVVPASDSEVPRERREPVRARCHLPVTITEGEEARSATVTDLSASGLRLKIAGAPRSKRIAVSHPAPSYEFEIDTVRCNVLWSRKRKFSNDYMVGLAFADDPSIVERSWVAVALSELGLDERSVYRKRTHVRAEASLAADIFGPHGMRVAEATAQNLSMGGALVACRADLDRDSRVQLQLGPFQKLPAFSVEGTVLGRQLEEDKQTSLYSVQFDRLNDEQAKLLSKYVVLLLKESSGLY